MLQKTILSTVQPPFHLTNILNFSVKSKTLTDLKKKGFEVKEGYTSAWTKEEIALVSKFMFSFLEDPDSVEYPDYFLYVSRRVLHGSKSRVEVKKYLTTFLKQEK